jgi:hypothetical protein
MRVQIINDIVIAYGKVFGENTFEGAPDDYTFDTYTYTPEVAGVFDPNGFNKIDIEEK